MSVRNLSGFRSMAAGLRAMGSLAGNVSSSASSRALLTLS
jgi:hypothetical protein